VRETTVGVAPKPILFVGIVARLARKKAQRGAVPRSQRVCPSVPQGRLVVIAAALVRPNCGTWRRGSLDMPGGHIHGDPPRRAPTSAWSTSSAFRPL